MSSQERENQEGAGSRRDDFARLILHISTKFINLAPERINQEIDLTLARIGVYTASDRAYVFLFSDKEGRIISNTHEWCAPGIEPQINRLKDIPLDVAFPQLARAIRRHEVINISRIDDVPSSAQREREEMIAEGIKSILCVPLVQGENLLGFLGFDAVQREKTWSEETVDLLKIVGNIIVSALERNKKEEALRLNEERYRRLVEDSFDGIFIQKGPRIIFVNSRLAEMLGYETNELIGLDHWLIYHPDYQDITRERARARMRGEPVTNRYEVKLQRKDNTSFEGEINARAITIDGEPGVQVWIRDITERKSAEEALRKSEAAARRLAEESAVLAEIGRIISSSLDISEVYDHFAKETQKILPFDRIAINIHDVRYSKVVVAYVAGVDTPGRRQGDAFPFVRSLNEHIVHSGKSIFFHVQSKEEMEKALATFPHLHIAFEAGLRSFISVPLISQDQVIGVLHFRSLKVAAYTEEDLRLAERVGTQIAGAIANAQLYASLKRAQEETKVSEAKFLELFDHAPVGYHEIDEAGRITRVNKTELDMLGYREEEMLGQEVWKFAVEEEVSRHAAMAKLKGLQPPAHGVERAFRRKDGSALVVLLEDRLLRDGQGKITGIRSTMQDITTLKKLEAERKALEEDLHQARQLEAIGKLAGGIAHDFNNLLTIIRGYAELFLLEQHPGHPRQRYIEEILKASDREAKLVSRLLAFSRRQMMAMKVIDLNELIDGQEEGLRLMMGSEIDLIIRRAEDLGKVKADPNQIKQIINDLAKNAQEAMPKGGKLIIETANVTLDQNFCRSRPGLTPGPYVLLRVTDTGIGMSPEIKERIFEPFFTTKEARETGKGTGLALAAVYGIVKQTGGEIEVWSKPGEGTSFHIYLPRAD